MFRASQGIRILPAAIFAVAASLALALPVCAQSDDAQRRYEEWKEQEKARQEAEWRAAVKPLIEQAEPRATVSQVTPALFTPGSSFRDCPECPEMVVIPAGTFIMGSPLYELQRSDSEDPRHRVSVRSFAMSKYEVTFARWDACVAAGGCNGYRPDDTGWGRGKRPVINVDWMSVNTYIDWLSWRTGKRYRLPSEAEWEYAARAGTTTTFHFGPTITPNQANYDGNYTYDGGPKGVYRGRTVPVGSYPSNAFGLHDVHGNVREWVEDCLHRGYGDAPTDGSAWTTGGPRFVSCRFRHIRGGAWHNVPGLLRSAERWSSDSATRSYSTGFRVVRTLDPQPKTTE